MLNSIRDSSAKISYLVDDFNPNSMLLEELPHFSPYLPSPLIYSGVDNDFSHSFSHDDNVVVQQASLDASNCSFLNESFVYEASNNVESNHESSVTINEMVEGGDNNVTTMVSSPSLKKRRSSKGDRHSKINTTNGLRDRRIRLSLEVARPFFRLQDMLGYDKPSRTIEWLLMQSKSAIEEQFQIKDESLLSRDLQPMGKMKQKMLKKKSMKVKKRATFVAKDTNAPKVKTRPITTKESRKEARERARNRTFERRQRRGLMHMDDNENMPSYSTCLALENILSCSTSEGLEMEEMYNEHNYSSQTHQNSDPILFKAHDVDEFLTSNWNPLTTSLYMQDGEAS